MTESFIQTQQAIDHEAVAKMFDDMAARIRLNKDSKFGGVLLLVPPGGVGNLIAHLLLSDQNPGYFWSSTKAMIELEYRSVEDSIRAQNQIYRR